MRKILTAYWFEFGPTLSLQFGVTAYSFDDAISILKEKAFRKQELPALKSFTENIKPGEVDPGHIVPNMGALTERGIWFPLGY